MQVTLISVKNWQDWFINKRNFMSLKKMWYILQNVIFWIYVLWLNSLLIYMYPKWEFLFVLMIEQLFTTSVSCLRCIYHLKNKRFFLLWYIFLPTMFLWVMYFSWVLNIISYWVLWSQRNSPEKKIFW